jgi:hypothetical protein
MLAPSCLAMEMQDQFAAPSADYVERFPARSWIE